jgi:hypothetical protein
MSESHLRIVLAEHLRPDSTDLGAFLDRIFSANEHLVVVPLVSGCHLPIVGGHVPGSDEPFEILHVVVEAIVAIPFLDNGHLPLAAFPDQQWCCASWIRQLALFIFQPQGDLRKAESADVKRRLSVWTSSVSLPFNVLKNSAYPFWMSARPWTDSPLLRTYSPSAVQRAAIAPRRGC